MCMMIFKSLITLPCKPCPPTGLSLCALVFVLGMKHGFDADHLATIDGLTRFNSRVAGPGPLLRRAVLAGPRRRGAGRSRWSSVGLAARLGGAGMARACAAPGSRSLFLTALGVLNLCRRAARRAGRGGAAGRPEGALARRPAPRGRPWPVALVGALFALSFDTVSQAALFALTADAVRRLAHALCWACCSCSACWSPTASTACGSRG